MDNLSQAIPLRHSVRKFTSRPLPPSVVERLRDEVEQCNSLSGLHIQLVTDEPKAFSGLLSYGKFSGVTHYFVMAGCKSPGFDERVGYYGERLVLLAQTLGLNTCWVGLSYRKVPSAFSLLPNERVACVIAVGYGVGSGFAHRTKRVDQVSNADASTPDWFRRGVEAALLAPTAINQQKFRFTYVAASTPDEPPAVIARPGFSLVGYTHIDLGIAKLHFELGAAVPFRWKTP